MYLLLINNTGYILYRYVGYGVQMLWLQTSAASEFVGFFHGQDLSVAWASSRGDKLARAALMVRYIIIPLYFYTARGEPYIIGFVRYNNICVLILLYTYYITRIAFSHRKRRLNI